MFVLPFWRKCSSNTPKMPTRKIIFNEIFTSEAQTGPLMGTISLCCAAVGFFIWVLVLFVSCTRAKPPSTTTTMTTARTDGPCVYTEVDMAFVTALENWLSTSVLFLFSVFWYKAPGTKSTPEHHFFFFFLYFPQGVQRCMRSANGGPTTAALCIIRHVG